MTAAASGLGKLIAVGGWLRSPACVAVKERFFGPLLRPMVEEASARGGAHGRGGRGPIPRFPGASGPRVSVSNVPGPSRARFPVSQVVQA